MSSRDLPEYPMKRTCPYHPPAGYERYRANGPVSRARLYDGRKAWLVTGHEQTRQVLLDAKTFSSERQHPDYPAIAPRFEAARKVRNLIGMDPPEHTAQRQVLMSSFTARRITALRPRIEELVDELLDEMLRTGPPADLVAGFALPVPSMAISDLLGVPYRDHATFERLSRRVVTGSTTAAEGAEAFRELAGYLHGLVQDKQSGQGDGLLDALIAEHSLGREELVDLALLLLVAGHETTASAIALGTLTLLENPDELAELAADPSLTPGAVDELLRFTSIVDGMARFATRDAELGGQRIRAGDAVILVLSSANRDPDAFDDPDTADLRRAARHHVSFGHGVHQCIGQNLARAELEIALGTLLRRIPTLRLAVPADQLPGKDPGGIQGVWELPVTW
jgi:pentalenic acid synthase